MGIILVIIVRGLYKDYYMGSIIGMIGLYSGYDVWITEELLQGSTPPLSLKHE